MFRHKRFAKFKAGAADRDWTSDESHGVLGARRPVRPSSGALADHSRPRARVGQATRGRGSWLHGRIETRITEGVLRCDRGPDDIAGPGEKVAAEKRSSAFRMQNASVPSVGDARRVDIADPRGRRLPCRGGRRGRGSAHAGPRRARRRRAIRFSRRPRRPQSGRGNVVLF
jgi:hypothetical protein